MIKLEAITKIYRTADVETFALNCVSLEVAEREFVAITGPSGCGKSTLLGLLGLLDTPSGGSFWFCGEDISRYSEHKLTLLRRTGVGFVFQSFNLIDDLNVAQNVEVALLYRRVRATERRKRVTRALEQLGMAHRAKHFPPQLSGGQQQRVAVARALVCEPRVLLADEPTGNLDTENGEAVMALLREINRGGATIIMVTHDLGHARSATRAIQLLDGRIISEGISTRASDIASARTNPK